MSTPGSGTLFILASASQALKGEAALARAGISCSLVPVPRDISSKCGVCLRVVPADRQKAGDILAASQIVVSAVHDLSADPSM